MKPFMQIDVFHDTVCPWCRIGKQHLKLALQQWTGEPVTVRYHTFFLNADLPPEGKEFRSHLLAKVGGRMTLQQLFDTPTERGAQVGLTFNFEAIQRSPNTLLSHRLIAITPEAQRETMIDAIYAAYFEHGRDIGDLDTLVAIAGDVGLNVDDTRRRLLSDEAQDEVLAEVKLAQELGVTGVPFFVVDNLFAFSGAHPPEFMLKVMNQALSQPRVSQP
jgi:predicted DsbA family dithiol-disulfide isomerase